MRFVRNIHTWATALEPVYIVHPSGNSALPLAPFPDIAPSAANILLYRNEFVKGLFLEASGDTTLAVADRELRIWALSRMLWNSDLEYDQVLREWLKGVYGNAWGPMLDYHRHLSALAAAQAVKLTAGSEPSEYITGEWLNTADRIIQRAFAQSMTDSTAHHYVRIARLSIWYARLHLTRTIAASGAIASGAADRRDMPGLLERFIQEMHDLGFARVSEHETLEQFSNTVKTQPGKR
jgi:hypothetical protein